MVAKREGIVYDDLAIQREDNWGRKWVWSSLGKAERWATFLPHFPQMLSSNAFEQDVSDTV